MKNVAKILLDTCAVKVAINPPFTWTSGIKSPVYCDNRVLISFVDERNQIIAALVKTIEENNIKFDVLAGIATAGIPWACFLADRLNVPMVFVRGKPKGHGTKKQIEGVLPKNSKVLLIEDLISTAKSSIIASDAIKKEGESSVVGILALMTWEMPIAKENLKDKLWTLTSFSELIPLAKEQGYISDDEMNTILKFQENPMGWGEFLDIPE